LAIQIEKNLTGFDAANTTTSNQIDLPRQRKRILGQYSDVIPIKLGAFPHMGVSKNRGTPKWMVYNGKPPIKMDDLGVPLFSETSIFLNMFKVTTER